MDKEQAKRNLIIIDEHLQVLQRACVSVGLIKSKSIKTECHQRAITSTTVMKGLNELIDDFTRAKERYMEIVGAKKVPIVIEKKLKLVVNNKTRGN